MSSATYTGLDTLSATCGQQYIDAAPAIGSGLRCYVTCDCPLYLQHFHGDPTFPEELLKKWPHLPWAGAALACLTHSIVYVDSVWKDLNSESGYRRFSSDIASALVAVSRTGDRQAVRVYVQQFLETRP